jgi:hypothetical protein
MFRSTPAKKLSEVLRENTLKYTEQRKGIIVTIQNSMVAYVTKMLTAHSSTSTIPEKTFDFDNEDQKNISGLSGCSDPEKKEIGEKVEVALIAEDLLIVRTGLKFILRWKLAVPTPQVETTPTPVSSQ